MIVESVALFVIVLTALVTFLTRLVGTELMLFIPLTPRLEAILRSMSVSVLVAIVASNLAAGGIREISATALAVLITLFGGHQLLSILAAMALGAAWTGWLGTGWLG